MPFLPSRQPQLGILAALICALCFQSGARADNAAPPAPDKPWAPPQLSDYEQQLARETPAYFSNAAPVAISPDQVYDLPALVDIAERSHPQTRVAWEQARQAARTVGLAESAYYPYLAAEAGAEFNHTLNVLTTVFPSNERIADTMLDVQWLLFDFGGRKSATLAAKEQLMMANVNFNATHQQIVFAVTKSFYDYNTARQKVAVEESSMAAADTVRQATQARFDNGLATKPDVLQAEQESAQAGYELEAARGDLSDAQVALAESMGILPTTPLRVAEVPLDALTNINEESLDGLIDRSLAQRPDLVAKLAKLRAAQDAVHQARAAYYPKISVDANAGWMKLDINGYDSPYVQNSKPVYGVGVAVELPIFDGFLRANKLRAAQSELRAAEDDLTDSRDAAVRQVWKAYTDLKTALRKEESADKLLAAAQSAFDASLESYRQGVGTYIDVANAQRNVTAAQSVVVDTHSAIYTASTALALSVGDLAKPEESSSSSSSSSSP